MTPSLMNVVFRLKGVKKNGSGYTSQCSGHDDKHPSLSIKEGSDGTILLYCHAGCSLNQVLDGIALKVEDLFPTNQINNR